ncbi:hypothetical protein [Paenibacillus sp. NPDC058071]|uniref:hypothetical protein n=1 Tax=Paenibacillus sp. NPDC058071 TaxID=3346326 RepID=UPI0036DC1A16
MKKLTTLSISAALAALLLLSACGANGEQGATAPSPSSSPSATNPAQQETNDNQQTDGEILILIDQSPKPSEGNSFDFTVKKRPEGYILSEMQWKSDKHEIGNTLEEAIANGGSGEDGFYISGNGQFMGFIYPSDLKGEQGKVSFTFSDDQGQKMSWEKEITLK